MSPALKLLPFILGIAIVLLLGVLIFIPSPKRNLPGNQLPSMESYITKQGKSLRVNIRPNTVVKSPLVLRGVASGWYFEGSFPVKILDAAGKIIGQGIATAEIDWMTSDPVPFEANLQFKNSSTTAGTLLLMNANPSDVRQYDDEVRIPVRF